MSLVFEQCVPFFRMAKLPIWILASVSDLLWLGGRFGMFLLPIRVKFMGFSCVFLKLEDV